MRYTPQHKAETRARLLQSAAKAAKRSGIAAASVDSIAQDAGISGGGIYHHFTSKHELFAEAIAQDLERSLLTRLTRSPSLTVDKLLSGLGQYLTAEHVENIEGGCPIPALSADLARAEVPVKQNFELWMSELHNAWTEVLGDPSLAWGVLSQSVGALMLARLMGPGGARQDVLSGNLMDLRDRLCQ